MRSISNRKSSHFVIAAVAEFVGSVGSASRLAEFILTVRSAGHSFRKCPAFQTLVFKLLCMKFIMFSRRSALKPWYSELDDTIERSWQDTSFVEEYVTSESPSPALVLSDHLPF